MTIDRATASEAECRALPYVGLEHIEKGVGNFTADFRRHPETLLATKFRFTPLHVLYGKLRPNLNKVALPDFDGVCTTEIFPLLPKPQTLDRRYLYAVLLSQRFVKWASNSVAGANLPRLDPERLRDYEVELPDLTDQSRIAGRLEQADRLRGTRRYALELTDTFLPAAFLEFFGDPAENPRAFDRIQLEGLFAHSRDGAKCGPFGSALKKHEYVATGIPVWTMNNVGANEFIEHGCLFITPQKFEELAAYDAQNGDILISRAGTVGRMAIVRTKHPRSIIHSNIIRLSLNHAKILPIYFVALMTWFAPRVARLKRGQEDAYTFMSTGSLSELRIPLPPFPLQQKFAALVERVEGLRAVQREALRQAEHLFASLLARAFGAESPSLPRNSVPGN
jgi:type I restriction enzyme, S subunit